VEIAHSLDEFFKLLEKTSNKDEEIFIIGGGQIYKLFIEKADKLYITHVNAEFPDADTFFPEIDKNKWQKTKSELLKKNGLNKYDLEFAEYVRK
jgi:dihydrofolate reductase